MQLRQIVLKEIGIPAEMDCELVSGDFDELNNQLKSIFLEK